MAGRLRSSSSTPSGHPCWAPVLSGTDFEAWERDGVVVLRNAIAPDEVAAIETLLWSCENADRDDPATWDRRAPNGIMVQRFQHPAMEAPRRSARMQHAFAQLYGHADLLASIDRLSFNPPERAGFVFPGPHLHWDTSLADPIPFETQAILYLARTEEHQGALRIVPGFHHRLANGWLRSLDGRNPRTVDLDAEAVPIAGEAGDLVIWRQELPHGASPNRASRPRLAMYVNMYPMRWPDERPWL